MQQHLVQQHLLEEHFKKNRLLFKSSLQLTLPTSQLFITLNKLPTRQFCFLVSALTCRNGGAVVLLGHICTKFGANLTPLLRKFIPELHPPKEYVFKANNLCCMGENFLALKYFVFFKTDELSYIFISEIF